MKKPVLMVVATTAFIAARSKDDEPSKKCDSCTSDLGNKFEICNNGDGTYETTTFGETDTINKSDLGGLTSKEFIDQACAKDGCDSCTSDLGNKFEICDNGNGTYDVSENGDPVETITKAELEGFTPKQVVELVCEYDTELEF